MCRTIPLPCGTSMEHRRGLFPLTQDSVLLSAFVQPGRDTRALDLGAGQGTLGLMLMARYPRLRVDGVELDALAAGQAERNYARAGFGARASVVQADFRALAPNLCGRYDLCVSNPPYFDAGSGAGPRSESLAAARTTQGCTADELCAAARRALRWGGRFFVCYRPERLPVLLASLGRYRLEPKRLRFVHHSPGHRASLALVEARLGGGSELFVPAPLFLYDAGGNMTPEALEIYR